MKPIVLTASVVYLCLGSITGFWGWKSEDSTWIVYVASHIFTLDPYSHYRLIWTAPPIGSGPYYPPVLYILLAPFFLIGSHFGWDNGFIARIGGLPLLLSDIASICLILNIITPYKPKHLNLITLVLFFSGFFLFSSVHMGHPDTLVVLFSLLGIKLLSKKKFILAGLMFGMAFSSKQSAILIIIPVTLHMLMSRNVNLVKFGLSVILVPSLLLLPLFIKNPSDTVYGIFGWSQPLIIYGPNMWWLIDAFFRKILHIFWVTPIIITIANPVMFLVIFALLFKVLRRKIKTASPDYYGLISLSLLTFAVFSKWMSFHYLLAGFVFFLIWETGKAKNRFPAVALSYGQLLFSAYFINHPLWQFQVLAVNLIFWLYILYALVIKK